MSDISTFFTTLIAESIGLEASAFDRFFDEDQQHKLKLMYVIQSPVALSLNPSSASDCCIWNHVPLSMHRPPTNGMIVALICRTFHKQYCTSVMTEC